MRIDTKGEPEDLDEAPESQATRRVAESESPRRVAESVGHVSEEHAAAGG